MVQNIALKKTTSNEKKKTGLASTLSYPGRAAIGRVAILRYKQCQTREPAGESAGRTVSEDLGQSSCQWPSYNPKDFDWVYFTTEGETLVERAPLFGDLIDATRAVVDLEERGGGRNLDSSKGGTELPLLAGYAPGTNATHHLAIQKKAKSNLAVAFGRTSSALLDSARRPRPDPEDGSNASSRTTPTPRQLDP